MKLKGKRIVLTGGTSGVGRELVECLAGENELIVLGRNAQKLAELRACHPALRTVLCDLADLSSVDSAGDRIAAEAGPIDVLFCNAAIQNPGRFMDASLDPAIVESEVTTNFTSICLLIDRLLLCLRASGRPSKIVLVNSALAIAPKTDSAVYCATKAALRSLGWSLGYQLANSTVSITQIFLPLVDTAMTAGRGRGKISARVAAVEMIAGVERGTAEHFVGKARWVAWINRFSPGLARQILRNL